MPFRRARADAQATDVEVEETRETVRSNAMRKALVEDGLHQLMDTIAALSALESRLQLVEDDVTAGEALCLPTLPSAKDVGVTEFEPRLMETALLIGAITRRMNLRLGAMERALDNLEPLGMTEALPLKSPAEFAALAMSAAGARVA